MTAASAPDLNRLTLLISHDRSGSHYLQSFIRDLPGQAMIDEVCNEEALDPANNPLSFFGFRYRLSQDAPDYALRRVPSVVTDLLDRYFTFVIAQSPDRNVTVDVKYGHIHNFEIAWWPIFRRPFLFEYLRSRKARVIHLSRWNSLETVISGEVAESRRIWHAIGDKREAQPSDAIDINKNRLLSQIASLNDQKNAIFRWTRNLPCLSVLYEELVDPDRGPVCRTRIAEFLGTTAPAKFSSPYRKVTPAINSVVRNWDEVAKFCRENDLAHYLLPVQE